MNALIFSLVTGAMRTSWELDGGGENGEAGVSSRSMAVAGNMGSGP
jgi:hypothetical protein